jgi:hypothetical protein
MGELLATCSNGSHPWCHTLPEGNAVRLGRNPPQGWSVQIDPMMHREHVDVLLENGLLTVRLLEGKTNLILFEGTARTNCMLSPGEQFQIGQTLFRYLDITESSAPNTTVHNYESTSLTISAFEHGEDRLKALSVLPVEVTESATDDQFAERLVGFLLETLQQANTVAVVVADLDAADHQPCHQIRYLQSNSAGETALCPSQPLITAAMRRGEPVLHIWDADKEVDEPYTSGDRDWAFCTPVPGDAGRGWYLFVAGRTGTMPEPNLDVLDQQLITDLGLSELVAALAGAILQTRLLEQ